MNDTPPTDTHQHTLPSGAWVQLLPPAPGALRGRHVRVLTRAISTMGPQRQGAVLVDWTDGAVSIVVQAWSCTGEDGEVLPIPSADMESLDAMDGLDYVDLINHEYVATVRNKLLSLHTERASPDDHDDPASPTGPSGGSGPALRAELSPPDASAGPSGTTRKPTSGSPKGGAGPRSR